MKAIVVNVNSAVDVEEGGGGAILQACRGKTYSRQEAHGGSEVHMVLDRRQVGRSEANAHV
jgi:hypothetical protein